MRLPKAYIMIIDTCIFWQINQHKLQEEDRVDLAGAKVEEEEEEVERVEVEEEEMAVVEVLVRLL